ncbi:MAG: orotate phosphoribosyltransferase [Calditrichaceae bacterium]|nr:orotate phosphoribosyltransferase [Calditrichaceae bacterium]
MALKNKGEFVQFLIDEKALRFGEFTLKSGLKSPFFINLGDIASGKALDYIGKALAQTIKESFGDVDSLYGPPYKGISLVTATAMAFYQNYGKIVNTFYSRKEVKVHGEAGVFVGKLPQKEERVLVIDDVLTTGGTKVEAIQQTEKTFGVKIAGVVISVDRRTKNADAGLGNYPLVSIINLTDIIEYLYSINDSNARLIENYYEEKYFE